MNSEWEERRLSRPPWLRAPEPKADTWNPYAVCETAFYCAHELRHGVLLEELRGPYDGPHKPLEEVVREQ